MEIQLDPDNFTSIPVGVNNIDRWIIRSSIIRSLRNSYPRLEGALLDVGCGKMPYRAEILAQTQVSKYTGLDIETAIVYDEGVSPDETWDGVTMPFSDQSFDCVLATEVFEHVPDIQLLLKEIRRVMRPGASLYFTTPFLWPYHEVPHDRQRWTAFGLRLHMEEAGFNSFSVDSHGNWHSSLAQFLGLWAARAPMNRHFRRIIKIPLFMIQKLLMRWDSDSPDNENSMPRMITGTATR